MLDLAVSCSVSVAQGIFNPSFEHSWLMSLAAVVHAVDFYLDEEQEKERHHILELLQLDDAESAEVLLGYAREALRELPILVRA